MKIKSIEEAISIIEESAAAQAKATETGDYKMGNKLFEREMEALGYLRQQGHLSDLKPFLNHKDVGIRYFAAYALLPIYEDLSRTVLLEISKECQDIHGADAKTVLEEWDKGNITYPFQDGNDKGANDYNCTNLCNSESTLVEKHSPEILHLSQIFETEPTDDFALHNEEKEFYVNLNLDEKELQVRINTFVNPYTQDVQSVYTERLARLAFLEPIATIEANKPSKLGGMQVVLTMPVADVTDDMLIRLKDVIFQMHSEQVPNESLVWFKSEYNDDICYFEGEMLWYPRRAVIMGEQGYERFGFFDEEKFDIGMWDIVTGDYDQLEYSDSFALISSEEFQKAWDATTIDHEPEPWD